MNKNILLYYNLEQVDEIDLSYNGVRIHLLINGIKNDDYINREIYGYTVNVLGKSKLTFTKRLKPGYNNELLDLIHYQNLESVLP